MFADLNCLCPKCITWVAHIVLECKCVFVVWDWSDLSGTLPYEIKPVWSRLITGRSVELLVTY